MKILPSLRTAFFAGNVGTIFLRKYRNANQRDNDKCIDPNSLKPIIYEGDASVEGRLIIHPSNSRFAQFSHSLCKNHPVEGSNGTLRKLYVPGDPVIVCPVAQKDAMERLARQFFRKTLQPPTAPYFNADVFEQNGENFNLVGRLGTLTNEQKRTLGPLKACGTFGEPLVKNGYERGTFVAGRGEDTCNNLFKQFYQEMMSRKSS